MTVNYCVYDNPPMIKISNKNSVGGIGADIINYVAEKENLRINYIISTWDGCLGMLETGGADIIFPIAFSRERAALYHFNDETVLTNWGQIYSGEKQKITSIPDLVGKKIAVIESDIYFKSDQGLKGLVKAFNIDVTFVYAESYREIIEAVDSGRADAGLINRLFGQLNENSYNVRRTPILIHPIEIRFAMPKGKQKSLVLSVMTDTHIAEMKSDKNSVYHKSLDKWMGVKEKNDFSSTLRLITVGLGVPLVFLFLISLFLEKKIKRKTGELSEINGLLMKEIEERKQAEEKLKNSEEKYSSLFQTSADPIIIMDSEGVIQDANNAVERQIGYTCDELKNRKITSLFPEFELDENMPNLIQENRQHFEKELYRKNGDKFDSEIATNSFTAGDNRFVQIIIRDITVRKKTQQILAQKKKDLEKRVQEEVEHNRIQEQMLMQQSKLAAMGQMINAIAHQWRQPLTTIGLYVQDVEDAFEYGELNMDYISQFRDHCMEQIAYMSKTIDDFRNFFKPDKEKEIFDICEIMREVLSLINPQLINNNIELKIFYGEHQVILKPGMIELPSQIKCVTSYGYPNEFKQVLLNLISNARDAIIESRSSGSQESGLVKLIVEPEGDIVKMTLEDNGCGIPDDIRDRVFEPYFSTKEEGQGVGIGLYMSKIIIENNMEGRIYANECATGASFTIELKQWNIGKVPSN
ncbi:PAS domain S-box protein [Geovibrio thiophilus]|nr:PAS domain S-box protein [Geovibrio thiophilus]